jgi:hypothetical protein
MTMKVAAHLEDLSHHGSICKLVAGEHLVEHLGQRLVGDGMDQCQRWPLRQIHAVTRLGRRIIDSRVVT